MCRWFHNIMGKINDMFGVNSGRKHAVVRVDVYGINKVVYLTDKELNELNGNEDETLLNKLKSKLTELYSLLVRKWRK